METPVDYYKSPIPGQWTIGREPFDRPPEAGPLPTMEQLTLSGATFRWLPAKESWPPRDPAQCLVKVLRVLSGGDRLRPMTQVDIEWLPGGSQTRVELQRLVALSQEDVKRIIEIESPAFKEKELKALRMDRIRR